MGLFDDVVDMLRRAVSDGLWPAKATGVTYCHGGADEQGKDKCCVPRVSIDIDGSE